MYKRMYLLTFLNAEGGIRRFVFTSLYKAIEWSEKIPDDEKEIIEVEFVE